MRNEFPTVLVVDFGAQYAQLIARRVREASVHSEIVPHNWTVEQFREKEPAAIIFSGGPKSVNLDGAPAVDPAVYELGVPILGICYGAQLIARDLGGEVASNEVGEYGRCQLDRTMPSVLFRDVDEEQFDVWMSHFDAIAAPPGGAVATASTAVTAAAAFEDQAARRFGVQFHPEVVHTKHGQKLIENFLYSGAGLSKSWKMTSIIDTSVDAIRAQVGDANVICGLSGGVDSSVAAALVHRAIGDRLTCVFVDTGLLRAGEAEQVIDTFAQHQGIALVHVDASQRFFAALTGVSEPEAKRKVIGELFIRVFEDAAKQVQDAGFLVQGTLYPDVIESGSATASTIKSHHNVGGLPEDMKFELVEPLRDLFKDEVRAMGTELGLPDEIVHRQPFPGPGLAVRIIGEVTPERVELVRKADLIARSELSAAGLDREIWQAFVVLADIRSVGVMGDERTYAHPVILRAVTSEDAMTADWARIPYDVLDQISRRIVGEVAGVNRVVYDITSKPPGTIEWE